MKVNKMNIKLNTHGINQVLENSVNIVEAGTQNILALLNKMRNDYLLMINKCKYYL